MRTQVRMLFFPIQGQLVIACWDEHLISMFYVYATTFSRQLKNKRRHSNADKPYLKFCSPSVIILNEYVNDGWSSFHSRIANEALLHVLMFRTMIKIKMAQNFISNLLTSPYPPLPDIIGKTADWRKTKLQLKKEKKNL